MHINDSRVGHDFHLFDLHELLCIKQISVIEVGAVCLTPCLGNLRECVGSLDVASDGEGCGFVKEIGNLRLDPGLCRRWHIAQGDFGH